MSDECTEIEVILIAGEELEDGEFPLQAVPIPISITAYDQMGRPLPAPPDNGPQAGAAAAVHYGDMVSIGAVYGNITKPLSGTVTYTNTDILVKPLTTTVELPIGVDPHKVSQLLIILKTQKLNPSLGKIVFEVNINIKVPPTKTISKSVSFVIDD